MSHCAFEACHTGAAASYAHAAPCDDCVVVLQLQDMLEKGKRGDFLPSSFRLGIALPSDETRVRGEPLA
jgi:hypothetical protein